MNALRNTPGKWCKQVLACILLFYLFSVSVFANLPKNNPVPGGVVVLYLLVDSDAAPHVKFGEEQVLVVKKNSQWIAIIGLSQETLPGNYLLTIELEDESKVNQLFRVNPIPATAPSRVIELPEKFSELEFLLFEPEPPAANEDTDNPFHETEIINPAFGFTQIVNEGQYVPYGLVLSRHEDEAPQIVDHSWITYLTPPNTKVFSPGTAVIEQISTDNVHQTSIVLDHGRGMKSILSNLENVGLKSGQKIQAGSVVGTTTTIDAADIGRVDWQLLLNDSRVNPLQFPSAP